jgi:hypothetical protein
VFVGVAIAKRCCEAQIALAALAIAIDSPSSQKWVAVLAFLVTVGSAAVAQTVKTKLEHSYERR